MVDPIKIKAGATFSIAMLVLLPAGTWSAACEIRKGDDSLLATLTVSLAPLVTPDADGNTHAGLLEATSVQTATWGAGSFRADVRFFDTSLPAAVFYTESFAVRVERGVTHG